jgi:hypothetical protein
MINMLCKPRLHSITQTKPRFHSISQTLNTDPLQYLLCR